VNEGFYTKVVSERETEGQRDREKERKKDHDEEHPIKESWVDICSPFPPTSVQTGVTA